MKINYISILLFGLLPACEVPIEEFALNWSKNVKSKIIEESHIESDRVEINSTRENWQTITYWKGNRKLKEFIFEPIGGDTVVSVFYSKSQEFDLVRELCPGVDLNFEGIRYKGKHIGLVEFSYCTGDLKEIGFRMDGEVGVWKEYDVEGNLINSNDFGNLESLKKLKKIKYK